jgi:DNA polymerase
MRDSFHDLETFSEVPIRDGTYKYAQNCRVMLWAFALEDGPIYVWDLVNRRLHWMDDLSGAWAESVLPSKLGDVPVLIQDILTDPETLVWFHNGGQFDFPVIDYQLPNFGGMIKPERRRDTMVQAYAHSLPGALDKLAEILGVHEDKRKHTRGRQLIQLFCKPQDEAFQKKYGTKRAGHDTHPQEWQEFVEYAAQDIVAMREAHRLMPMWNYKGKQVDLWLADLRMNGRGFAVDLALARGAVKLDGLVQKRLAKEVSDATEGDVESATQRDALLAYILAEHGVALPDMRADTLERRLNDPDLPDEVKELLRIRLQASMNSVSKYATVLKGVSADGRLRGCSQFRGAGRTGRWAHRMFQPGNLPRQTMKYELIEYGVDCIVHDDLDGLDMVFASPKALMSNAIRGTIIAPPGRKLVVADLANIEGRVAAWLAGEDWKLQAFRDFDAGHGHDLYILAYAKSFNVDPDTVGDPSPERQIGKVEELMFQYGGGVGAWITGAATYGIDLDKMTEQVWPVLPGWAVEEAEEFLEWLCRNIKDPTEAKILKVRYGLRESTFIACDAIKRLWRAQHPKICSYWKELEDTVRLALDNAGTTYACRKVKVRRDGQWLRIGLPSGRALCYPNPGVDDGGIYYTGQNTYTRKWGRVRTYGGKLLENIVQAVACDQFAEPIVAIEQAGYLPVEGVHDEWITETFDDPKFTAAELARMMCMDLGWNEGLPLAAKGFETYRYRKG